ncbi:MMPL family transporter [Thalassobacillus sp. C254]|uniref:MMPL family transporter n=1 Tax=Thalassobacillus sp. C254 TaxID=1225341 RepID=UPI0006D12F5F|nr:MMPL family transporter [Thalassobacillus sp. C254]
MLLLGEKLFWPVRGELKITTSRTWTYLGRFSVYKPGWTILILALILIPAIFTYDNETSFDSLDEISDEYDSVRAFDLIAEKFGEGEAFPATVVVEHDEPWDAQSLVPYIQLITQEIEKIEGIEEVRSVTQPEGNLVNEFRIPFLAGEIGDGIREAVDGLEEIAENLFELEESLSSYQGEFEEAAINAGELAEGTESIEEGAVSLENEMAEVSEAVEETASSTEQMSSSLGEIQTQLTPLAEEGVLPQDTINGLNEITMGLEEVAAVLYEIAGGQAAIGEETGNLAEGAGESGEGQAEIQISFEEVALVFGDIANGLGELGEGTVEAGEGLAGAEDIVTEIEEQERNPLEGFFVANEILEDEELEEAWDSFSTPNRQAAIFNVVFEMNPYSNEAMDLVDVINERVGIALEGTELEGNEYSIGGLSSMNRDLGEVSDEDFVRTAVIMLSGIFLVLVFLLRSLVMPLYILASLILTYLVSVSLTEFIFVTILGYSGISWAVPFFGFVMLMALGVDYSIFLMARFAEDVEKLPVKEAWFMRWDKLALLFCLLQLSLRAHLGP